MTLDDIQCDYNCAISVEDYRLNVKKSSTKSSSKFPSTRPVRTPQVARAGTVCAVFSAFRKLDDQLRKRTETLMKGVNFPPLYRRRALFCADKRTEFNGTRARDLDKYINVLTINPQFVAFHVSAVTSQPLKSFVGFNSGFGANANYNQQDATLRPSSSILASSTVVQATASVMGDDDDDFRSVSMSESSGRAWNVSAAKGSVAESEVITPEIDIQRAQMKEQLVKMGLVGVGMPPNGSCLLHCIVYEMYPLQCLKYYPDAMTVVNVGAADGMAPRRVAAAQILRVKLMEYALKNVHELAGFLMQDEDDVRERYECFRDTPDEQATTAELYAVASMFNLELVLISNDENFQIDPVVPVEGLPSVREGLRRTVTLG
ncbi:hypothetical protein PsorP6_003979 [Peronosclerospora sorghi]|uniref:Uncharacterized protein n=1 Tax=Peronosclerospora sorghi TaxID=230839 RepID=A0ACC0VKC5_9STRA|nr:hypothetical protein PsorP6_003979 [Peronosclerospora sorghi]